MLENVDIFEGLNAGELQEISKIGVMVNYDRGDYIFKQGDFSRDFYIISSGQIEVSIKEIFGGSKTLNVLKNGDFFGEMALFDKYSSRSANAIALQKTVLFKLPGQKFEELLQSKPSISFKLLGALSKRIKEMNQKGATFSKPGGQTGEAKVLTIASARNGYGKTTFATSFAHLLSSETAKEILFIDLDLFFADGTYAMGVFSPKSILNFLEASKAGLNTRDDVVKHLVKHTESLYSLPGPKDFLEGEKVDPQDFTAGLKILRKYFHYIVIDTDSALNELFLSCIELSDSIFFLVDARDPVAIKSNLRFFQGLNHLNLPEERINLLTIRATETLNIEPLRKLFKFRIIGGLPDVRNLALEHGTTLYQKNPSSSFCEVQRAIIKEVLKDQLLVTQTEKGFFSRLFFPDRGLASKANVSTESMLKDLKIEKNLKIQEDNSSSLLKIVRQYITNGYLEKASEEILRLVDIFPNCAGVFEILGEIYFLQRNFSNAIEVLEKAVALNPNSHMALGMFGTLTSNEATVEKALKILKDRMSQNNAFPDLENDYGKLMFFLGRLNEAKTAFEKALKLNPNYGEARINLSETLGLLNNFGEALQNLALIRPPSIKVHYLSGKYLFNSGKFYEALQSFESVSAINPLYQDVGEKISELNDYFGKLAVLLKMHQDLVLVNPHYPDLHCKIGNILVLFGKMDEAVMEFQEALKINPKFKDAQVKINEIQKSQEEGKTQKASSAVPIRPSKGAEQVFFLDFLLDKVSPGKETKKDQEIFSISVKNIENERSLLTPVTVATMEFGKKTIDCTAVCPVSPGNVILVQIIDRSSNTTLASLPRTLTKKEIKSGRLEVNLKEIKTSEWHYPLLDGMLQLPVKYFQVSLLCGKLAKIVAGPQPEFSVELANPNTQVKSVGKIHSENSEAVSFVLMSPDGRDVARQGDHLVLNVLDQGGNQIFSVQLPVLKEDLDTFSKTVALEELGVLFADEKDVSLNP